MNNTETYAAQYTIPEHYAGDEGYLQYMQESANREIGRAILDKVSDGNHYTVQVKHDVRHVRSREFYGQLEEVHTYGLKITAVAYQDIVMPRFDALSTSPEYWEMSAQMRDLQKRLDQKQVVVNAFTLLFVVFVFLLVMALA